VGVRLSGGNDDRLLQRGHHGERHVKSSKAQGVFFPGAIAGLGSWGVDAALEPYGWQSDLVRALV